MAVALVAVLLSIICLLPLIQSLPQPPSFFINSTTEIDHQTDPAPLLRYRTNFFDVLRLKSRLVRSSSRNVTAALMLLSPSIESNHGFQQHLIISTTTTETPLDDRLLEIDESHSQHAFQFNRKCGMTLVAGKHDAISPPPPSTTTRRQGKIVGGEVVHHGEFPWMVSKPLIIRIIYIIKTIFDLI